MTLLASCYTDTSINSITWLRHHVAPPFNHLHLTNEMVPLMTLLTLCVTYASINGIT